MIHRNHKCTFRSELTALKLAALELAALAALIALSGCGARSSPLIAPGELLHYQNVALTIETPNLKPSPDDPVLTTISPETISANGPVQYWDMKLSDAMHIALARSKVMHDLGGAELRSPQLARTISDPAIADTDPRYGVESALADYDAVFNANVDSQHNHRALNNIFFGGGTRILIQDLDTFKEEIVKETPTGTQFTFRHNTTYDNNNEPGNLFASAWDTNFEAQVRQHLLQGAGLEYNRIAGPHGSPGQMNGVLIARINTDVALTDFQMGIRDLASNVENAYWDLYFAYRDLDAKVLARDNALESWRRVHALNLADRTGGEAYREAQVRQQYFQFQEEVENAWNGRLLDATHTDDGSGGGTFRGIGGVRVAERRLRRLLGLPITDCRLIRPADEPALAKMVFCWGEILPEALTRRPELRRERWMVKRRELELIASRNFLLPTLDVTGLYRFRGFGHDLIDSDPNQAEFASAYGDLGTGMFQEWELGAQFSMPLGERKGHAAVRNAQLMLARERAILDDQEQEVVHDLSNAMADVDRAYDVAQTAFNRRIAARSEVAATKAAFESDKVPLDLLLEAQRREADAESGFFAALVEYALAIKNLHYAKGSLLDYNEIYLSEGPWPDKAYADAARIRERKHELLDYRMKLPPVSNGPIPQPAGDQPMLGLPPGAEVIPPGEEIGPMPSTNLPPNMPPPNMPRANVPPASAPPFAPRGTAPLQKVPPRAAPPQPLPPESGPDLSGPATHQQPDLQPRYERPLGPAVQPAMSRPLSMDELLASQPPPAAAQMPAVADAPAPVKAVPSNSPVASANRRPNDPSSPPSSSANSEIVILPASNFERHSESAPSPAARTTTIVVPTTATPAALRAPIALAPNRTADGSTLSIYSRAAGSEHAPAPSDRERMGTGSDQNPQSLENRVSREVPVPILSPQSAPPVSSATANQSTLIPRASWPESTVQPPMDRNDGTIQPAPAESEGSIWTRTSVRPASYPTYVAPAPVQSSRPPQNDMSPYPRFAIPAAGGMNNRAPAVGSAAGQSQASPAAIAAPSPSAAEQLQPLPPLSPPPISPPPISPVTSTINQTPVAAPQSSSLNIVQPLPPLNRPVPQPNSIEPLPPFAR